MSTFIQVLRLQYRKEVAQSHVSVQTKFNYAWGLVKCPRRDEQTEGVKLLQGWSHRLFNSSNAQGFLSELYREEPTRRRECLYYLALGYYKMGDFDDARKFNSTDGFQLFRAWPLILLLDLLLEKEPSNLQAQSLGTLIEKGSARGSSAFFTPQCSNLRCSPRGLYGYGPCRRSCCSRHANHSGAD